MNTAAGLAVPPSTQRLWDHLKMAARKPAPPETTTPALLELIGGTASCRRLSVAFYARVAKDPVLRPLFPGKSFKCAIDQFTAFLAQFLGGPGVDAQPRWSLSLQESHMRFRIGPEQRAAWLRDMLQAFDDVPIQEPARTELLALFDRASTYLVNHGSAPAGPDPSRDSEGPVSPKGNNPHAEISRRWEAQSQLDQAVAALRTGNADRAISLAESAALQTCIPSVHAHLLALMIRRGQGALLAYVRDRLTRHPALVHERLRHGRTLLHEAAAAGSLSVTELLLSLGAPCDARDGGGHTPLYCLGNECGAGGAENVVRALVRAGADVNSRDGVKRCTPLHMAARRGHLEIAAALLDCGADIEARDSAGVTPLRRALNCRKEAFAELLLARGAKR